MRGGNQKKTHILAFKGENNKTKTRKKKPKKDPQPSPTTFSSHSLNYQ
jgi:hypothetical protein